MQKSDTIVFKNPRQSALLFSHVEPIFHESFLHVPARWEQPQRQ